MRNFLLAGQAVAPEAGDISKMAPGKFGVYYMKDGVLTYTADGKEVKGEALLVLGRSAEDGGNITLPIHKHNFSFVKSVPQAPTKFAASFTCPAPVYGHLYTVVLVKKGVQFNERNKWTCSFVFENASGTANDLAKAIAKAFEQNALNAGVEVKAATANVNFTALNEGVNYTILLTDSLDEIAVNVTSKGFPGFGNAEQINEMARVAGADAGFEYTYQEANTEMYPNYPFSNGKNKDKNQYVVFTLKCSEPRNTRTIDTAINQVVQIAFNSNNKDLATYETVFKGLAG